MSLLSQIQAFIGSILIGGVVSLLWVFLDVFLKSVKPQFLRLIIEIPYFIVSFYLYDLFLIHFIDGVLNVFYLLAIVIGILLYFRFYNIYFLRLFIKIKMLIKNKIIDKINLKLKYIKDIIKIKKVERDKAHEFKKKQNKN